MCETPPTHRGDRNYPGSMRQAREGFRRSSVLDIMAMVDEECNNARERLSKNLATSVDEAHLVDPSVSEKIGHVEADDVKVQVPCSSNNVGNGHTLDSRRCHGDGGAAFTAKIAHRRRAGCIVESLDVDGPTNADVIIGATTMDPKASRLPRIEVAGDVVLIRCNFHDHTRHKRLVI